MLIARAQHRLEDTLAAFSAAFPSLSFTSYALSYTTPQYVQPLPEGGHLILTSPAAVDSAKTIHAHKPTHCVGKTTAELAKQQGLNIQFIGSSNGVELANIILENLTPPQVFHHLTTHEGKTNWYKPLIKAGHAVQRHIAYTTEYNNTLTPEAISSIQRKEPICLFSPKSAEHLLFLINKAKLSVADCTAHCFSPAIAQICTPHFKHVKIAETPTLNALMETL